MSADYWSTSDLTKSNVQLTDHENKSYTTKEKIKAFIKNVRAFFRETTVEPSLFIYMLCIALSSLAVQNMHLEKSCRVNLKYGDEICDRIRDRNTTGLETELNNVQSLVATVIAWKFPLQTGIPALVVLFIGAWSDKTKKRKICILFPMIGEMITNVGLLLATYYFEELSLTATALIEALPPAMTGSYIIIFMGMYSFMADRTTIETRTFRLGIVTIFVNLGTPTGTALSGIILRSIGYYGVFSLILFLHCVSFTYGLVRLEDVVSASDETPTECTNGQTNIFYSTLKSVFGLVANTFLVIVRPRVCSGRTQIFLVLVLYLLMVGPLYGDSQVAYLYAIRKFNFNEVEYSVYGTINIILGLIGTVFCISVLSKKLRIEDSIIGFIAGVSRIAACFVFALSPNRKWFYSAPLFNIFASVGLTAVRSIATKSVPTEEIAKLSSVMGVMEALAPSIYMPTSSYIYVKTIDYFPGAFYIFDAALTAAALGLFLFAYAIAIRRRNVKKKNISKTVEVSRF